MPEIPFWWRHNGHDCVSNHQPRHCFFNRLFGCRSKQTSKLRATGLCARNSPGPVNSPPKGPVTRKMFPSDDVIMNSGLATLIARFMGPTWGPAGTYRSQVGRRHLHYIWNTNMAAWLHLGNKPFRIFCVWSVWVEVTYYFGNHTSISSLSFDRHSDIKMSAWLKLGMHTKQQKIGNKAI